MGFTKLDDGLVFSSLMREDDATFRVFILLLSLTRADGIAPISSDFLQTMLKKGSEEIDRCLQRLESPDPSSRTDAEEGRRIRRVDGGFYVINYQKYRAKSTTDYERDRKREQRKEPKNATCPGQSGTVPGRSASASASASDLSIKDQQHRSVDPPTWRTDFGTWLDEEEKAHQEMVADPKWVADMQRLNTDIDVSLSLEKARRYWRSEEAWIARKKKRGAKLNWRRTYENALSSKMNRVYPPRDAGGPDVHFREPTTDG